VELLEGRIVDMTPIGSRHASVVNRLTALFTEKLRGKAIISVQNPIDLDEYSEPEPDIVVLKHRADYYSEKHPEPEAALLVVEVADTSLDYDRSIKIPLYAKANIQEVWLVNLTEKIIEIYQDPSPEGYSLVMKRRQDQTAAPKDFPELVVSVSGILGL